MNRKILTVQGIGDIFWTYQKIAPYVDSIDFRIAICWDNEIQKRAGEFAHLLPKVRSVEFQMMPLEDYHRLAALKRPVSEIIQGDDQRYHWYAVNRALEEGTHISRIDPGYTYEDYVDLVRPNVMVTTANYMAMFVAGGNDKFWMWPAAKWVGIARDLMTAHKVGNGERFNKIKLIGASWDMPMAQTIVDELTHYGYDVENLVGRTNIVECIQIIKDANFFFGYQSGLNIIAHNYGIPQLMVYFPHLVGLMKSWVREEDIDFHYFAVTMGMTDEELKPILDDCYEKAARCYYP